MKKISVNIYVYKNQKFKEGCSSKKNHCGSCSSCGKENLSMEEVFLNLKQYLKDKGVYEFIDLNLVKLQEGDIGTNVNVDEIIEQGFEPPITEIEGIVRYYGGISKELIYKDIKELLT